MRNFHPLARDHLPTVGAIATTLLTYVLELATWPKSTSFRRYLCGNRNVNRFLSNSLGVGGGGGGCTCASWLQVSLLGEASSNGSVSLVT